MKKTKWLIIILLIGCLLMLTVIAFLLFNRNSSASVTELDCLKLGSDARAEACLKLLKEDKVKQDFPTDLLQLEGVTAQDTGSCIQVSGSIVNTSDTPVTDIQLRIDFSKEQDDQTFHYEVFSPFSSTYEQIQPGSPKTFVKCLRWETYEVISLVDQWLFSVYPFKARVSE